MPVAQTAVDRAAAPPFGAVVARQLSMWPFAARTQRLYLLIDPSQPDTELRGGVLRAMQQAYFRSDSCSQTRAVRETALAAHYVLQHHNRDVLPESQISAATAVAAIRGDMAYVALAGDAAAFALRRGELAGLRERIKQPRPIGLEREPGIRLWSTPLEPGDRLVLVCGGVWRSVSADSIKDILTNSASGEQMEQHLAELLGEGRPAGVLIADPVRLVRPDRHLVLISSVAGGHTTPPTNQTLSAASSTNGSPRVGRRFWLTELAAVLVLAAALLLPSADLPAQSTAHQAQALLAQAEATLDPMESRSLAANALELTQLAPASPAMAELSRQATQKVDALDRAVNVSPALAVRLGPAGVNVVDLAVGDDYLYTLDVVEASVRAFSLDGRDQQPTPDTLLTRAGAPIGGSTRALAAPVAMRYLRDRNSGGGALAVVDQARSVVEIGQNRALSARPLASSSAWREIGVLGGDGDDNLFVLDSGTRSVLSYPISDSRVLDQPRLLLDASMAPSLPFDQAADIVGRPERLFVRLDDGSLHRFDQQQGDSILDVRPPDGRAVNIAGLASDRGDGLFLADPLNSRVLHTTADGHILSQLRNPSLSGLRQIQSSPDGRRLYGLVAGGVLVFDVPADPTD